MTTSYPVEFCDPRMAEEFSKTPFAFRGFWLHSTSVKSEICSNGWKPHRIKNSIYGAAVYLSRGRWNLNNVGSGTSNSSVPTDLATVKKAALHQKTLVCVLALKEDEIQSSFRSEDGSEGITENHLINFLNLNVPEDKPRPQGLRRINKDDTSISLRFSRTGGSGSNRQNQKIAEYFRVRNIRAIKFLEHDVEVVAVFDPSCIRVIGEDADLDIHPFPEILAAGQVADARPLTT
jgi:hypothetical protein